MSDIKWQEPPTSKQRPGKWAVVAEALRANPGSWALIAEGLGHANLVTNVTRGATKGFQPAGAFEATSHKRSGGTFDIYARFVGEQVSA